MWENYNFWRYDYNECSSHGNCSIAPNVSSLQEILLEQLKEAAYYLKRLKLSEENADAVINLVLHALSEFVSVSEYTEDEILSVFKILDKELNKLRKQYSTECKLSGQKFYEPIKQISLTGTETLSTLMSYGERLYLLKIKRLSNEEKFYTNLLLITLKSLSRNLLKISDYGVIEKNANKLIIDSLNLYNLNTVSVEKIKKYIDKIALEENRLFKIRSGIQREYFGEVGKTVVLRSTRKGKAVLVSGSSLIDLYDFLEYTKNVPDLDIYTHGDLMIAHAFEKFKAFANLRGHYGVGNENCLIDFTTFPGTILLTRHSRQNLENIIRGRIFTMDEIQPKGATKITKSDFFKVVDCALNTSRGFRKGQIRNDIIIGFNDIELDKIFVEMKKLIDEGDYKRILIIGMPPNSALMEMYLRDMVKELSSDIFIINFSGIALEREHIDINVANNFPLMYRVLEKIGKILPATEYKYGFYLQKCDPNSISGIIGLINDGAQNIMLADCPPNVMNPTMLADFGKFYGVKLISTPKQDAKIFET